MFEARYDERLSQRSVNPPDLPCPRWQGEPLAGRSLVVFAEQGFGDTLQFCRYLPVVKARGVTRLKVVCPPALVALIGSMDGVDACVSSSSDMPALPSHDVWCFLLSLPALVGTMPTSVPYLHADAARVTHWRTKLPRRVPTIGLVWSGEARPSVPDWFTAFSRRWLDFELFAPLLSRQDVAFVSLQKGPAARAQLNCLPDHLRPIDPMDEVRDFADTAAIIASLDGVVSIDTSVAHLAGALGKPVWLLLCSNACWRWLDARDDSPWYPTARLFRQAEPGEWEPVIEAVAQALDAWTADLPTSPA